MTETVSVAGDALITDFGARADGVTNSGPAIQAALDAVAAHGGGRVIVPPGHWRSGMIRLRSRVELHCARGSLLQAHDDPEAFPILGPTPAQNLPGVIRALVVADGVEDIAITGSGTLHGNGDAELWGDQVLQPEAAFRPALLFLRDSRQILLRDVRLHYSAFWTCHLLRCEDVLIDGIDIRSHRKRINVDGIDPDGCRNVRIRGCSIDTTDDAVCIKSTEGDACEDIIVSDCVLTSRCCALKVGTEGVGDIRRVLMQQCVVRDSNMGIALYQKDGSTYEDITIANCLLSCAGDFPLYVEVLPRYAQRPTIGRIRRLRINDCTLTGAGRCYLRGHPDSALEQVSIRGLRWLINGPADIAAAAAPTGARRVELDPLYPDDAPRPYHLIASHCHDSSIDDCLLAEERSAGQGDRGLLYLRDCDQLRVSGGHRLTLSPAVTAVLTERCRETTVSLSGS